MQAHKATLYRRSSDHRQLKQQSPPRAQGAAPCISGNPTQIIRTRKQAHIRLLHPEHTPSAQVTHQALHIPAPTRTCLPKLFNTQSTQKLLFQTEKGTYSIQLSNKHRKSNKMGRQKDMPQIKEQGKTPEKNPNEMEIISLIKNSKKWP